MLKQIAISLFMIFGTLFLLSFSPAILATEGVCCATFLVIPPQEPDWITHRQFYCSDHREACPDDTPCDSKVIESSFPIWKKKVCACGGQDAETPVDCHTMVQVGYFSNYIISYTCAGACDGEYDICREATGTFGELAGTCLCYCDLPPPGGR